MTTQPTKPKYHKIWKVQVASKNDFPASVFDKPIRATYLIESSFRNGTATVSKKAMKLAGEEGIPNPVIQSSEWINSPWS